MVLVVDDNSDLCHMLAHLLESGGQQCSCASNATEAIQMLEQNIPDLVLSDLMMPERSGLDLLREVRSNPRTREVPFIIFSAVSDERYIKEAMSMGADDYWLKGSLRAEELEQRIHAFLPARSTGL